jgi:hypothetical protein
MRKGHNLGRAWVPWLVDTIEASVLGFKAIESEAEDAGSSGMLFYQSLHAASKLSPPA